MSDILLVHGSGHGAWCWRDVIPALQDLGHSVRAIDMPSHGEDKTPLSEVTLENCAEAVVAGLGDDTVVVGHSWGGYPISRAVDLAPGRVSRLIYLCAYVPRDGLSLAEMRRLAPRQPLLHAVVKSDDGISFTIDPDKVVDVFYHDCPVEAVAFAARNLSPQAIAPQETPIALGPGFAAVPKSYIRCMGDRTIPPEFQVEMTADWPTVDVFEMPTSHSPFFSDPVGLARLIDDII
ncbi:alpha/beta fold hydrolase [Shimia biformata]|uniref:alpha/beta fold hydrolase n=1 Tax=Shimia biformata TaxID=1294299 RepID=UPI00195202CE|nr:alpha/beta fold hydrolase [Shimia biformata]